LKWAERLSMIISGRVLVSIIHSSSDQQNSLSPFLKHVGTPDILEYSLMVTLIREINPRHHVSFALSCLSCSNRHPLHAASCSTTRLSTQQQTFISKASTQYASGLTPRRMAAPTQYEATKARCAWAALPRLSSGDEGLDWVDRRSRGDTPRLHSA